MFLKNVCKDKRLRQFLILF